MIIRKYKVGDSYPNLRGILTYRGSVDTANMTVELIANNNASGAFSGVATRSGGNSESADRSTFEWTFDVTSTDTAAVGEFVIELKITHASTEIETIHSNLTVEVIETHA